MKLEDKLNSQTLEMIGIKEKHYKVYVALLRLGSASLRTLSEEAGLNRGTTYDALKALMSAKLVSFVDSNTHRFFTAEDPSRLRALATQREVALQEARNKLLEILPELQSSFGCGDHRPAVRYYEGERGVRQILADVLSSCEHSVEKSYQVYSSGALRKLIAKADKTFKKQRVKKGVSVRAISFSEGGELIGLDERKWLKSSFSAPTYIFIYPEKTAYVSVDSAGHLFGAIITDKAISETQKMIFNQLWETL